MADGIAEVATLVSLPLKSESLPVTAFLRIVAPHVATIPGFAIMVVVVGFNLFGDGLRGTVDPRLRQ